MAPWQASRSQYGFQRSNSQSLTTSSSGVCIGVALLLCVRASKRLSNSIGDNGTIGSSGPNIADIKLCSTLEFLSVVDYPLPDWARAYMDRIETALGDAYSEPAGDVRGYIASVKS